MRSPYHARAALSELDTLLASFLHCHFAIEFSSIASWFPSPELIGGPGVASRQAQLARRRRADRRAIEQMPGTRFTCGMERIVNLHIEKLPEGVYLATTEEIPGLVAQGRTVTETLEIAMDVARKLLEARAELPGDRGVTRLPPVGDRLDLPLIVGT